MPEGAKKGVSYRLSLDLIGELKRRAEESGLTTTDLAERYLDEGLRRDHHPLIFFRVGAAGRRAALVGTRLDVASVIEAVKAARADGDGYEAAAEYLGIPLSHVRACVSYYAEFKDEVDDWVRRTHEVAERQRAAWQREQSIFA